MNRPSQVKPDNIFLLIFKALRNRRVPIVLRVASHSLLLTIMAMLIYAWVMSMQFKQAMHQQAEAIGQSLTAQTAASATQLLVANDTLSLNVLLSNLVTNPLVAHAAVYSVDNRVLAEAGSRPNQSLLGENDGLYSTPITFQEVIAGQLRISLDMTQFQQPMTISLQNMALLSGILLALSLWLSLRLGRQLSTPLLQLRLWLRDPDDPAPGSARQDEIGDLARQLQARLVAPRPEPEAMAEPEPFYQEPFITSTNDYDWPDSENIQRASKPAPAPILTATEDDDDPFAELRDFSEVTSTPSPTPAFNEAPALTPEPEPEPEPVYGNAVLAIQLGAQEQLRHLPKPRLLELLQRYRDCLDQAAALYQGKLFTLNDGSSLMLFSLEHSGENYMTHALCCGELLRALGHALQIEVADSGITLQLQLGLTFSDEDIAPTQAELLLSEAAHQALALAQHSRNLLLLQCTEQQALQLHNCARLRSIVSPEGACCVERLIEPYPALIGRQLTRLHEEC